MQDPRDYRGGLTLRMIFCGMICLDVQKPNAVSRTVIVPYHSKDLKKGLEQAILKQAWLK